MHNDLDEQLKQMGKRPLSGKEKEMLWSRIERRLGKQTFFQKLADGILAPFYLKSRAAFAFALILIFAGSSVTTALAANNAKPGDFLFPFDIAAEKFQLIIASKGEQDKLRVKFAEERLDEVRIILAFENIAHASSSDTGDATASSTDDGSGTAASSTPPKHSKKAEKAIATALAHLEKAREILEEHGNAESLAALENVIDNFSSFYEETGDEHDGIEKIKEVKIKIKEKKNKIEIDIRVNDDGKSANGKGKNKNEKKIRISTENDSDDDDNEQNDSDEQEEDDDDGDDEDDEDNTHKNRGKGNTDKKVTVCHKGNTITVSKNALPAHIFHGDTEGSCGHKDEDDDDGDDEDEDDNDDEDDSTATSTPDTTAPVLSNILASIHASSTASTTADISWDTNEAATATLHYSVLPNLSDTLSATSTVTLFSDTLATSHSFALAGLTGSSTYYFLAISADEAGNAATSSEHSFETP